MAERVCHGLVGDWLNAWLAAVGSTVLSDRLRLRWTTDTVPVAALSVEGDDDPVETLIAAWPDSERLNAMPIAYDWDRLPKMSRKVPVQSFSERARAVRSHPDSWALSSTMTDLHVYESGDTAHGPLDPPGPGTIKWLHHRLLKAHAHIDSPLDQVPASLEGRGSRVVDNGLGFDLTRVTTQADSSRKTVDPVIEVLCFFGLAMLPVRGAGVDLRMLRGRSRHSVRQRGWRVTPHRCFEWPVWRHAIDRMGLDALLDIWHEQHAHRSWERLGVHAAWRTVSYQSRSSSDPTVGYGSERL